MTEFHQICILRFIPSGMFHFNVQFRYKLKMLFQTSIKNIVNVRVGKCTKNENTLEF